MCLRYFLVTESNVYDAFVIKCDMRCVVIVSVVEFQRTSCTCWREWYAYSFLVHSFTVIMSDQLYD